MRLNLRNVSVIYNAGEPTETIALRNCSLDLVSGKPLIIYGPNGSGKTTLLKVISGDILANDGKIFLEENGSKKTVNRKWLRRYVEHVYQQPGDGLFGDLSLMENFALRVSSRHRRKFDPYRGSKKFREAEAQMAEWVPFYVQYRHRRLRSLSGGEERLFAISLAEFLQQPVVLLDEPTAGLDTSVTSLVEARLEAWLKQTDKVALVVTHDLGLGERIGFSTKSMSEIDPVEQ